MNWTTERLFSVLQIFVYCTFDMDASKKDEKRPESRRNNSSSSRRSRSSRDGTLVTRGRQRVSKDGQVIGDTSKPFKAGQLRTCQRRRAGKDQSDSCPLVTNRRGKGLLTITLFEHSRIRRVRLKHGFEATKTMQYGKTIMRCNGSCEVNSAAM